jgi:mono/diheme cytochrome c family protein
MYVAAAIALYLSTATASVRAAQDVVTPPTSLDNALPRDASGEEIFRAACATCHGVDGKGARPNVVGFDMPLPNGHDFPDFNDCPTNTVEPLADWVAVATLGGPVRGLDRHMPAFGDALSADQIEQAVRYVGSMCADTAWPRGDLNLPRAFFTEKAFPENEAVWVAGVTGEGAKSVANTFVYEHRIGARGWIEISMPFTLRQALPGSGWSQGLGDVEISLRRVLFADADRGSIFSAGGSTRLPTGKESEGLGNGFTNYEVFGLWGQIIKQNGFAQVHSGYVMPSNRTLAPRRAFFRTALGYTFAEDQGFGRAWSPMAEVTVNKRIGADTDVDVVPQVQVSLSKLQHVLLSAGVRVPLDDHDLRKPTVLMYVLWDWFDGGLFQFWK